MSDEDKNFRGSLVMNFGIDEIRENDLYIFQCSPVTMTRIR